MGFRSGEILIVARPGAGAWRVKMAGTGLFFVVAQAKSSISVDHVEFVERGGGPGHEGLFPIKGPVRIGMQTIMLTLTAPPGELKFRLINPQGDTLEPLEMESVSESGGNREFVRTFPLKHPSFRVAVEGRDEAGYPYQRVLPRLIQVIE